LNEATTTDRKARAVEAMPTAPTGLSETGKRRLSLAGGVFGALAMSACCIVPLVLFGIGVSGAWIGNLTALYPYKPYFLVVTAGFLGSGFYLGYRRKRGCDDGSCALPLSERVNRIGLWSATVLAGAALAFPYLAPYVLD